MLKLYVTQNLHNFGQLSLSASQHKFIHPNHYQWQYNVSYSGSYNGYHFNLSYLSNHDQSSGKHEHLFSANLVIPMERWLPNAHFTLQSQYSPKNFHSQQATLTGTLFEETPLFYTIQQNSRTNQHCCFSERHQSETQFYAQYNHPKFIANAGYGYNQQHQFNYGLKSAVILHPYGLTSTSARSDTSALVIIPNTKDAQLDNQFNSKTNSQGHVVINHLRPYKRNNFSIDTHSLPLETEIESSYQHTTPTKGALVMVKFPVKHGHRVFFQIQLPNGKEAPFGAIAILNSTTIDNVSNEVHAGMINDMGQLYLNGLDEAGTIKLKWGPTSTQQCEFDYQLDHSQQDEGFYHIDSACRYKEL